MYSWNPLKSAATTIALCTVLAACGSLSQRAGEGPSARASRPPNIVLILADDLGHEVLNSYGGTSYRTPHLDALAAGGMRFERAYATPLCTPTRVQLMTGKHNFRNYERFAYLNPRERTFANHLKEAGYATAIAGKWQLGGDARTPHGFGFDEYLLWQLDDRNTWSRFKDPILARSGAGTDTLRGRYGPDLLFEFVDGFIERNRNRPFLVYYPMLLTHDPFSPPPGHPDFDTHKVEGTNDPRYFPAMVEYMDQEVGRLMRRLEEHSVRENTLVLFIGDNGTDVNITSRKGDQIIKGDKGYTTDAGTHVPLIAHWPAGIQAGQVRPELVDVGDLFPTLLDAAGLTAEARRSTDAVSLYPTLRTGTPHPRTWIFRDYFPRWGKFPDRRYAQDRRYKLYESGEFYDYVQDPTERSPLSPGALTPEARGARATLQGVLDRMRAEIRQAAAVPAGSP